MQGLICQGNADCSKAGESGLVCCGHPTVPMAPKYCDTPARCTAAGFSYQQPASASEDGMSTTAKVAIVGAVVVGAYWLATRAS